MMRSWYACLLLNLEQASSCPSVGSGEAVVLHRNMRHMRSARLHARVWRETSRETDFPVDKTGSCKLLRWHTVSCPRLANASAPASRPRKTHAASGEQDVRSKCCVPSSPQLARSREDRSGAHTVRSHSTTRKQKQTLHTRSPHCCKVSCGRKLFLRPTWSLLVHCVLVVTF